MTGQNDEISDVYWIIFFCCAGLALLCLVVAIILFFVFKITDKNNVAAASEVQQIAHDQTVSGEFVIECEITFIHTDEFIK